MTIAPRLVLAPCALFSLLALNGCHALTTPGLTGLEPEDPDHDASELAKLPAASSTSAGPAARVVTPRPWEHDTSDIRVDPRIHFGALDNGLRWAWARNGEPQKRCYLRLHVDVGSLAEEESERGMAHFLEHMAFNGSVQFPAGTLIEWFQKHGMAFGADTNASTNFSQTVYKLDLPNA